MAVIKTDKDIIVHERANGVLWVYERNGLPAFSRNRKVFEKSASKKSILKALRDKVQIREISADSVEAAKIPRSSRLRVTPRSPKNRITLGARKAVPKG
jgi:predicted nucleic acid-binding protein